MRLVATGQVSSLSLGDKLSIAGIIVAVVAIFAGIWAVRHWGVRRRRVLLTCTSTRLIPNLPLRESDTLKVTFRDFPVDNPHLLLLRLQNIGPIDLTSDDFDAKRSIVFTLNCMLYGIISTSHPEATASTSLGSDGAIELMPMLLKRKEAWEVTAIVSGNPRLDTDIPLANTDVLDKRSFDAEVARSFFATLIRATAPLTPGGSVIVAAIDALPFGRSKDL